MEERRFDKDEFFVAAELEIGIGIIPMPGHDCIAEDHHLEHMIEVFLFEVTAIDDPDKKVAIAIPIGSSFILAAIAGTLGPELVDLKAEFDREKG